MLSEPPSEAHQMPTKGRHYRQSRTIPEMRKPQMMSGLDRQRMGVWKVLNRPGERVLVTRKCQFEGEEIQFVVWYPARSQNVALLIVPALLLLCSATAWAGLIIIEKLLADLPSWFVLIVFAIVFWQVARRSFRYAGRRHVVSQDCSGFLVVDTNGDPVKDLGKYQDYFAAFVLWEETFLRPVAVKAVPAKIARLNKRIRHELTRISKNADLGTPRTEVDREVKRIHVALTRNEEDLNPLLDMELVMSNEINNLSLKVSEEMKLDRRDFTRKLHQLRKIEGRIIARLDERAILYDCWLAALDRRSVWLSLRFTKGSALFALIVSALLAKFNDSIVPFSRMSLPFFRYTMDSLAGVRKLKRARKTRNRLAKRIDRWREGLNLSYDPGIARIQPLPK